MNERIEQLKNQATHTKFSGRGNDTGKIELDVDEFAELIIKDCIGVIRTRYMGDNNREDMEVLKCIDLLKQHYGIQQ